MTNVLNDLAIIRLVNTPHKDSNKKFSIMIAPVFHEEDGKFISDITKLYTTKNQSM